MQKRANYTNRESYDVEYVSFEKVFRNAPGKLYCEYTEPPRRPVESLHHHDAVEVGYCISGSGVFFVDGENIPFTAPCASVLYPGQLHKACSTGEADSRWLFVTFHAETIFPRNSRAVDSLPWETALAESALTTDSRITGLAAAIAQEVAGNAENREDCIRGLLAALLVCHGRLPRRQIEEGRERNRALEKLRPLLQFIDEHYTEEMDAVMLAEQIHVHPATLRSWFHSAVGLTTMQYVHRVRISAACSLLRGTDRPVTLIAGQVGYRSLPSFNRNFYAVCGCTPSRYRENGEALSL